MARTIPPDIERQIDEHVRSGRYASAEDVMIAALASLRQQESIGDFATGELDAILAEGEASEILDGEAVLAEFRQALRGKAG